MFEEIFFLGSPPRAKRPTLLYGLEPKGFGTGDVESLHSYLLRLAYVHRVTPNNLVYKCLSEIGWNISSIPIERIWSEGEGFRLIGHGDRAAFWHQLLSQATGLDDLDLMTLRPLRNVVGTTELVDKSHRVCLKCCQEDIFQDGHAYGRLLWRLRVVTCCPIHQLRLTTVSCGQSSKGQSTVYKRVSLFGVCGACGSINYQCFETSPAKADPDEVRTAVQCRDLIAGLPALRLACLDRIKKEFREYASGTGGYAHVAIAACIPKSQLARWLNSPSVRLSLQACIHLSNAVGIEPLEFLNGRFSEISEMKKVHVIRIRRVVKSLDHVFISEQMVNALQAGKSIAFLQRELNVDSSSLRSCNPEIYILLVERAKQEAFKRMQRRHMEATSIAFVALQWMWEHGLTPSLRNAERCTGQKWRPSQLEAVALVLLRRESGDFSASVPSCVKSLSPGFYETVRAAAALLIQRPLRASH